MRKGNMQHGLKKYFTETNIDRAMSCLIPGFFFKIKYIKVHWNWNWGKMKYG